jgi:hypothetical protein
VLIIRDRDLLNPDANNEHSFRQSGQFLYGALNSFHDERARCPAQNLDFTEPVNMGVIPIQSRRLVCRNAETILERLIARLDRRLEDVVLMADCRNS